MNFVIDQGNTFVKLAVFEGDKMIDFAIMEDYTSEIFNKYFSQYSINKAIIASVKKNQDDQLLKKYNFLQLSPDTPLPLTVNYKTPQTLGIDRIAAVVGAQSIYSKENVLVIDMGTCITYDFLDKNNVYMGGSISPGFQIRFKALSDYTSKLPLIASTAGDVKLIGDTTESAIYSGIHYGVEAEINGIIKKYNQQYSDLKIVVTGGDVKRFDLEPKNRIFADEFLVLRGLNEILNYNEKVE